MSYINLEKMQPIRMGGFDPAPMLKIMLIYFVIAIFLYIGYRTLKKYAEKKNSERGDKSEI